MPKKSKLFLLLIPVFVLLSCCSGGSNSSKENNLSTKEVNRIAYLCKLWGALKHFSSNTSIESYDWNSTLLECIEQNPKFYKDSISFTNILQVLLKGLPPINSNNNQVECTGKFYWIADSSILDQLTIKRINLVINNQQKVINNQFNEFINDRIDLDHENKFFSKLEDFSISSKLVALFRYWNIIQYYYPYKELMDFSWDQTLLDFIPEFIKVKTQKEIEYAFLQLFCRINDGHAFTDCSFTKTWYDDLLPSFYIDNKNKIYWEPRVRKIGLMDGDEIIKVNYIYVDSIKSYLRKIFPHSNQSYLNKSISKLVFDYDDSKNLDLEFKRGNKFYKITLIKGEVFKSRAFFTNDIAWKNLKNNILYLNVGKIKSNEIKTALKSLKNLEVRLILDLRDYPADFLLDSVCYYLNDKSRTFSSIKVINRDCPGTLIQLVDYTTLINKYSNPLFKLNKCILLVNENTMSHGEFSAMCYQTLPNTKTFGKQTAGADGDLAEIQAFSQIRTGFSSIKVTYCDGSETQRKGVKIDRFLESISDSDFINIALAEF